uniref:lactadherin-like isoform X1 n=1 Tax=Styela clava TaxID=7725 RepID=UPI0019396CE5|nr:lactadherin-like isoform X1 [Styela clava]
MKSVLTLAVLVVAISVGFCDIPNVYEFCNALMSGERTSCDRATCQGRPGKRGAEGPRGLRGPKGEIGPIGSTEEFEVKIRQLSDAIKVISSTMLPTEIFNLCAMGMKSRAIPDSAISVSSEWIPEYHGRHGRLDEPTNASYGVWHSRSNTGEWFQVDFEVPKSVSGVITQGRPTCCNQWVKTYKVLIGNSTDQLQPVTENGRDKIFTGNTKDGKEKVTNIFPAPVTGRYIRIYPQTWNRHAVMRLEFLRGECFHLY